MAFRSAYAPSIPVSLVLNGYFSHLFVLRRSLFLKVGGVRIGYEGSQDYDLALDRPKQGFVLPMRRWLAQWFESQLSVREYFLERAMPSLEVARLAEQDLSEGVRRERLIFALMLLIEWHQSFKSRQSELKRAYREREFSPEVRHS